MGRPRTFDEQEALERAVDLFWERGYEATSMADLLEHMGLSRQSLYNTYGDKHALFMRALRQYAGGVGDTIFANLMKARAGLEEVKAVLRGAADRLAGCDRSRACFMLNTAVELAQSDSEVKAFINKHYRDVTKAFINALSRAKERGELPSTTDVQVAADYCTVLIQGLGVVSKSGVARERVLAVAEEGIRSLECGQ